ncbi:MAG: NAD(P)/FAD-dependent oxidoreductase [Lachnospirales bacterium]
MDIDVAVIGAGPAGLSAAINVKARNKTVEVFGRAPETSLLYKAENINNHLGYENVTGEEMINSFVKHANSLDIKINHGMVTSIQPFGDIFMINQENNIFQAKTIVVATGIAKKSSIKNEEEYIGKGVSYCATCDGMFYKKKDVVVYGEIEEAEEDVNFLSEICNSVTYVHSYNEVLNVKKNDNVKVVKGRVKEVIGDDKVQSVVLSTDETVDCSGVFIIKGSLNASSIISGIELENNMIKTNKNTETNIPGIFACGDCTGGLYQVSKAIGEGLVSGQMAVKYISKK